MIIYFVHFWYTKWHAFHYTKDILEHLKTAHAGLKNEAESSFKQHAQSIVFLYY